MAQYFLHYGAHTFELIDAKSAVELRERLTLARANRQGGYLTAKTTDGAVGFYFGAETEIAFSITGMDTDTDALGDDN